MRHVPLFITSVLPRIVRIVFAASILASAGCAYHFVDTNGNQRIVGFVDIETKLANNSAEFAGELVKLQTFGLLVSSNPVGSSMALGYDSEVFAQLKNNSLVVGNPLNAINFIDGQEVK